MPENPPTTPDPGPVASDSAQPAAPDPTPSEAASPWARNAATATTPPAPEPAADGPEIVADAPASPAPPLGPTTHPAAPVNPAVVANHVPPQRIPSRSARAPLPGGLLAAVGAAGLAGAILVPVDRPGLGWLLAGLAVAGTVYGVDRAARRAADRGSDSVGAEAAARTDRSGSRGPGPDPKRGGWERMWWRVLALARLGVGVVRDAPWLFGLCVVGALVAGSLAVVRRSVYGLWFDVAAVPFAGMTSLPWLFRAAREPRGRARVGSQRVWWSVAVAAALLVVVVPLLAGADAVFAGIVNGLVPSIDVPAVVRWGFVFVVVGLGTAGMLYLLAAPPPAAGQDRSAGGSGAEAADAVGWWGIRRFSPVEGGIPVGALTIVFAAFVGTQVAVLFGGDGYVQRTAGLTYAEYARSGFWQLSIVSMLTLAVIAGVLRCARQESAGERRWLRGAIAVVCGLTLLIVASALHRMWTYQEAYGFTVLRLLVEVFEGWIALVYLLVLVSLISLRRGWVPRAAIGAAAVTLLGLAVLDPERLIAERNIDRWQAGKNLDTSYLSTLSADALPAADRLPDPQRAAIAEVIRARLERDSWQGWNYARATARR
ncbi:DUF4173 domain-containing protein [Nocardia sp. JMUB6875]|uniref:DUF4153 domain-containing protein n=1 Tax=Nocardia sp. JMUB6875 TaxID=3158170 RepID=UPI0032E62504